LDFKVKRALDAKQILPICYLVEIFSIQTRGYNSPQTPVKPGKDGSGFNLAFTSVFYNFQLQSLAPKEAKAQERALALNFNSHQIQTTTEGKLRN